jgi:hypothetical protein
MKMETKTKLQQKFVISPDDGPGRLQRRTGKRSRHMPGADFLLSRVSRERKQER